MYITLLVRKNTQRISTDKTIMITVMIFKYLFMDTINISEL